MTSEKHLYHIKDKYDGNKIWKYHLNNFGWRPLNENKPNLVLDKKKIKNHFSSLSDMNKSMKVSADNEKDLEYHHSEDPNRTSDKIYSPNIQYQNSLVCAWCMFLFILIIRTWHFKDKLGKICSFVLLLLIILLIYKSCIYSFGLHFHCLPLSYWGLLNLSL